MLQLKSHITNVTICISINVDEIKIHIINVYLPFS